EVLKGNPSVTPIAAQLSQLRLGRLTGFFTEKLDVDVRVRFDETVERLRSAGGSIVDVQIPRAADGSRIYVNVAMPEAYAFHAKMLASKGDLYSPSVRARLELGRNISAEEYVKAQGDRVVLRDQADRALSRCDVLILPSMAIPAPPHHADTLRVDNVDE